MSYVLKTNTKQKPAVLKLYEAHQLAIPGPWYQVLLFISIGYPHNEMESHFSLKTLKASSYHKIK